MVFWIVELAGDIAATLEFRRFRFSTGHRSLGPSEICLKLACFARFFVDFRPVIVHD